MKKVNNKINNKIKIIIKIVIFYILSNIIALLIANPLIFFPPKKNIYKNSKAIIHIPVKNNNKIAAVYLPNKKAKYTIIFSHGNAEDLGRIYPFLKKLQEHGYSVFSYDYEGYGLSTGSPSEKNTYQDVLASYNYVTQKLKVPPTRIISMGHSLGSALATYLAYKKQTAGLILMSPFTSAFRVITRIPIFFGDKYNNLERIKKIHTPVLIMHGTKDKVIPFWHGEKLYENANQPKKFIPITGAGHNNILYIYGNTFWKVIKEFTKNTMQKNYIHG